MEQTTLATALPGEDANHKMANLERNYDELQVPPDVDVFWLVDMVNLVPPPHVEKGVLNTRVLRLPHLW